MSNELVHDVDVVGLVGGTLLGVILPGHGALGDHLLREMQHILRKINL